MALVLQNIIHKFEERLPLFLQEKWDQSGLNLGNRSQKISAVLFSYDVCHEVVDEAIRLGCQLIVSHHPLRLQAPVCFDLAVYENQIIQKCLKHDIALYAAHTNHDASSESLNYFFLNRWGVQKAQPLQPLSSPQQIFGLGAWGSLPTPLALAELIALLKSTFGISVVKWVPSKKTVFQTIGICTGSGTSLIPQALTQALDVFITGDVKYHQALDAKRGGLAIADVGHFYSEKHSIILLKNIFTELFAEKMSYHVYTQLRDAFEWL